MWRHRFPPGRRGEVRPPLGFSPHRLHAPPPGLPVGVGTRAGTLASHSRIPGRALHAPPATLGARMQLRLLRRAGPAPSPGSSPDRRGPDPYLGRKWVPAYSPPGARERASSPPRPRREGWPRHLRLGTSQGSGPAAGSARAFPDSTCASLAWRPGRGGRGVQCPPWGAPDPRNFPDRPSVSEQIHLVLKRGVYPSPLVPTPPTPPPRTSPIWGVQASGRFRAENKHRFLDLRRESG